MMCTCRSDSLKVVVADDDDAVLRLIAKITASAGHETFVARNGDEAWDRISEHNPDLLITDWEMPGLDGIKLCSKLRQERLPFYVYVLLLTAKSQSEDLVMGLDAGADDFLSKPVDPPVLLARLKAGARMVAMERRLHDIANLDPLTGIMNRRSFQELFALEWARASRFGHSLSCVMIDLDFFKRINDMYGHAAGDAVLQETASLLGSHRRSSDYVARYGGEEFCVLLPETDEGGAAAWAERLLTAIAQMSIPYSGQILNVTGSLGVATRLENTTSPEALIALTDQALGVAKESGRNRVVRFGELPISGPTEVAVAGLWQNARACDVMTPAIYCPNQHDSVDNLADAFLQLRLNAAPVLDEQGCLAGMISEADILAAATSPDFLDMSIRDSMKTNVVQYDAETPAVVIYQFLSRATVPRVVVVDNSRPVGVISRGTLLRWLRNWATVRRQHDNTANARKNTSEHSEILKALDAARECVAALGDCLATADSDFMPCAVTETTRLESVSHKILAYCRGRNRA